MSVVSGEEVETCCEGCKTLRSELEELKTQFAELRALVAESSRKKEPVAETAAAPKPLVKVTVSKKVPMPKMTKFGQGSVGVTHMWNILRAMRRMDMLGDIPMYGEGSLSELKDVLKSPENVQLITEMLGKALATVPKAAKKTEFWNDWVQENCVEFAEVLILSRG